MNDRLSDEQVAECAVWEPWPFAPHEKKPTLRVLACEVQESRTRIAALEAELKARDPEGEAFMLKYRIAALEAAIDTYLAAWNSTTSDIHAALDALKEARQ